MKIHQILIPLSLLLTLLGGCADVAYLSRLGWHQGYIHYYGVPIQAVLKEESATEETKEKIRFIQEVKRYGEERLGLRRTKSYSTLFEARGPILYVLTACEKDRLQLHRWRFPIVGEVTYKGFFTKEEALKEKRWFDREGYDTFLQGAEAYSTLGWLSDPIFSPMLEWSEATLANLILHEMSHGTLYFKGRTEWNEQLATFIGNRGSIHFLRERYGNGSREVREAVDTQEDDHLFSKVIDEAFKRLSAFYRQKIPREEKLRGRKDLFRSIKEEFKRVKARFKTGSHMNFEKTELNNAVLMAYRRYFDQLDSFDRLYDEMGGDLRKWIAFFRKIQASKEDPSLFWDHWARTKGD